VVTSIRPRFPYATRVSDHDLVIRPHAVRGAPAFAQVSGPNAAAYFGAK
jgi:hypothetical protein